MSKKNKKDGPPRRCLYRSVGGRRCGAKVPWRHVYVALCETHGPAVAPETRASKVVKRSMSDEQIAEMKINAEAVRKRRAAGEPFE